MSACVTFNPGDRYTLEVTRNNHPKSPYAVRWSEKSLTPSQLAFYWEGLNIGLGYKARLRLNGKIVARKVS